MPDRLRALGLDEWKEGPGDMDRINVRRAVLLGLHTHRQGRFPEMERGYEESDECRKLQAAVAEAKAPGNLRAIEDGYRHAIEAGLAAQLAETPRPADGRKLTEGEFEFYTLKLQKKEIASLDAGEREANPGQTRYSYSWIHSTRPGVERAGWYLGDVRKGHMTATTMMTRRYLYQMAAMRWAILRTQHYKPGGLPARR